MIRKFSLAFLALVVSCAAATAAPLEIASSCVPCPECCKTKPV